MVSTEKASADDFLEADEGAKAAAEPKRAIRAAANFMFGLLVEVVARCFLMEIMRMPECF